MFTLLKLEDKNVLKDSNFVKNAIFYKDMLCFYNAYETLMEQKDKLPNFCFKGSGEFCLEGLCLIMKMYATEFKFETLKLSLDYLKVLYYAIASYAEDDSVDSEIIIAEFDSYRLASEKFCEEQQNEVIEKKTELKTKNKEVKDKSKTIISMQSWSKALKVTAWVLMVLSALGISAPILVMASYTANSTQFILSVIGVVVGFVLAFASFIISKKLSAHAYDLTHHVQNLKKNLETQSAQFNEIQAKFYRIFCEKYEYSMYFAELFSRFTKTLSIDQIIEKAHEYRLLSYNMVYDINRIFKSQQKEIEEIIADIETILVTDDYQYEFGRIYTAINEQDWLYYNAEVRYHFLKKFADFAEREHKWKLNFGDAKVNPFDVDVKALSREKIAFTKANDSKLIQSTVSELVQTKYFKSLEDLNFTNGYSVDVLKRVKSSYLTHFYNYEVLGDEQSVFFDKKGHSALPLKKLAIDKLARIPTFVGMKLRLIEGSTGLGNSDAKIIKSIASSIFTDYIKEDFDNLNFKEEDIDYPKFTANKTEETDDSVIYYVGDEAKVGYKLK